MGRVPSNWLRALRLARSRFFGRMTSGTNIQDSSGNRDNSSHAKPNAGACKNAHFPPIPSPRTTKSGVIGGSKNITTVTSTRLSSIVNIIGLSRKLPMGFLKPRRHWRICHPSGCIPARENHWPFNQGFGIMFSAAPLFSSNAVGQAAGKERVQQ